MCWASAAATIVNYLLNRVVTGFEICNHLGIGYDTGGTIYDVADGINYYGLQYNRISNCKLGNDEVESNIDDGKPFVIVAYYDDDYMGHDITGYGYYGTTIYYWDSNANNGSRGYGTFEYNQSGSCLVADGKVYSWVGTLSYE